MDIEAALDRLARKHAAVVDDVSCPGTSLEAKTWCVNKKAFLFVSAKEPVTVRFKLDGLAAAAKKAGVDVGNGGWSKLVVHDALPAAMADWIAESYALMAATPNKKKAAAPKKTKKKASAKKKR